MTYPEFCAIMGLSKQIADINMSWNSKNLKAFLFFQLYKDKGYDYSDTSYLDEFFPKLEDSFRELLNISDDWNSETLRYEIYEIGKRTYGKDNLRDWFRDIYIIMMQQSAGPRLNTFIELYGISNFKILLQNKLNDPW